MAKAPIIVIKRVKGHAGHHGGAWKVAYADFVTAMMALFIVLWLLNTSEHTKKVIAGYFNDPMGHHTESGSIQSGTADALPLNKENIEKL
jgi:chemotaxis protein MotB